MVPGDAPDELLHLRAELALAREQAEQARDKALVAEAEVAKVWAINADLLARNAHLELMNEQMRRDKYGARSERNRRVPWGWAPGRGQYIERTQIYAKRRQPRSGVGKHPFVAH